MPHLVLLLLTGIMISIVVETAQNAIFFVPILTQAQYENGPLCVGSWYCVFGWLG